MQRASLPQKLAPIVLQIQLAWVRGTIRSRGERPIRSCRNLIAPCRQEEVAAGRLDGLRSGPPGSQDGRPRYAITKGVKMFVRFLCNWPPYRDGQCLEVTDRFGAHFVARRKSSSPPPCRNTRRRCRRSIASSTSASAQCRRVAGGARSRKTNGAASWGRIDLAIG